MSDPVISLLQRIAHGGNVARKNLDDASRRRRIVNAPVMTMILVALICTWYLVPRGGDRRARTGLIVTVIDGRSFRIPNDIVRLANIDTPELRQTCKDARGGEWACGIAARDRLIELTLRGGVVCRERGRDREARMLGACAAIGARDIGEELVRDGLAIDYGRGAGTYFAAEREAREARRGLWAGSFDRPEEWRRKQAGAK